MQTEEQTPGREPAGWDPETPFETVVAAHQRELLAHALRILGERTLAEDVLQETFLKAYRALDGLPRGSNIRAWLYRILVNTSYDKLDRQKTRQKAMESLRETAEQRTENEQTGLDEDVRRQVEDAILSLPEKYRGALQLRSIQGLPYSGVAEALAIPETTARSLVHRGKGLLLPKLTHLLKDMDF
jgi:RNA polymerase sigma-70 factor (ECF subfamily)